MTDLSQLIQGSEEWLRARCGSLGASQIHLALAKIKSGWGASRENVMADLICERLTGEPTQTYESEDMRVGKEREPLAREAYCWAKGWTLSSSESSRTRRSKARTQARTRWCHRMACSR